MSAPPPFSVVPITSEDIPTLATQLQSSKQSLTINRLLWTDWPSTELQRANSHNAIKGSFESPAIDVWKAVNTEIQEILGFSVMTKKDPSPTVVQSEEEKKAQDEVMRGKGYNPVVWRAVTEAGKEIDQDVTNRERIDLIFIFVVPAHRRKGVGSGLLKPGLDKALTNKLPFALQSEPAAHKFFHHHGFKDTRHVDFDLTDWSPSEHAGYGLFRLWGMILEP